MSQIIYSFEEFAKLKEELGSIESVRNLIGEKASYLSEAKSIGVNIPLGFIVSSNAYSKFNENDAHQFPEEIYNEILKQITEIENQTGLKYGSPENPLLLSCRCDCPQAMPGMLDTVLNIGMNDLICSKIEKMTKNRAYAFDSYRRVLQGFGSVVLKIPVEAFEDQLENYRLSRKKDNMAQFTDVDWIEIVKLFKSVIMKKTGIPFPQDPREQLKRILNSAYFSFESERAKLYRNFIKMPDNFQPSLIISQMVYGNNGPKSGACVMYSRNPMTGSNTIYGEYAVNCLVDDVSRGFFPYSDFEQMKTDLSTIEYNTIKETTEKIEKHFKEPEMIDFIVDKDKIYVLQIRPLPFQSTAKFTAVKDMAESGMITKDEALSIISTDDLKQLMLPQLQTEKQLQPFCTGLSAGNGAILGRICLTPEAVNKAKNHPVLVVKELLPKDFATYLKCDAVVTTKGGNSSHAALISRQLMRTAIINCQNVTIDKSKKIIQCEDITLKEGDIITVTGDGQLIKGKQSIDTPLNFNNPAADEILKWADEIRKGKLNIYSIIGSSKEAGAATTLGADGVGIFPLESFFNAKTGVLIRALCDKRRSQALTKLEPAIQKVVAETFTEAKGIPVTIRLFKPTLSSFQQDLFSLVEEVAKLKAKKEATDEEEFNEDKDLDKKSELLETIKSTKEQNPLFGLKGIRLNIVQQDFLRVQLRAILNGIKEAKDQGVTINSQILLPMVTTAGEIKVFRGIYDELSTETLVSASIGVEVENPRACAIAHSFAKEDCDFITIQSTELTENTFSCSQSYAERTFMTTYQKKKFISKNPFETLDVDSVGNLMKICVDEAKKARNDIPVGVAGDLCGDPNSIAYFYSIGANYISCQSKLVPIARLCSAQAVIKSNQ